MNLQLKTSAEQYPTFAACEQLTEGRAPIVVEYQSVSSGSAASIHDTPDEVFVNVNGWCENAGSFAAETHERLLLAHQAQASVGVVSITANRYCQADQDEALETVLHNLRWERPATLNAHSRGGITAVRRGPDLYRAGLIDGMILRESCGYSKQNLSPLGLGLILLSEAECALDLGHEKSRQSAEALIKNVLEHELNVWHYKAARREVEELTSLLVTEETLALSSEIPLLVVNGLRDRICSAKQSREALAELPASQMVDVDTSHLSLLLRQSHIRKLLHLRPIAPSAPYQSAA
jgi:pimeloyl-ACP methyl ester carboxylesterase